MSAETGYTAQLRERLRKELQRTPCPTCGVIARKSLRKDAERIGVKLTALWRFLSGKPPSAENIDAFVAFLERRKRRTSR